MTARVVLGFTLVFYWAFCTYGILQIRVGLTSEKLFLDDSPLLPLVRLQTEVIFKEGGQVSEEMESYLVATSTAHQLPTLLQIAIFVNNPGDLRRPEAVPEIMRILDRFERAPGSVGQSSTQMWLNPYLP